MDTVTQQTPGQSVLSFGNEDFLRNKFASPYDTRQKEKISVDPRQVEQDLLNYQKKKPYATRDSENFKITNDSWAARDTDKKDYDHSNSFVSNGSNYNDNSFNATYNHKNRQDQSRSNHLENLESKYRNDRPGWGSKNGSSSGNRKAPGGQGIKRFGRDGDPMMELEMKNQRIMQAIAEIDDDDEIPLDREGGRKAREEKKHFWRKTHTKEKEDKDRTKGEKGFWGFLSKKFGCGGRGANIICSNFVKEKK